MFSAKQVFEFCTTAHYYASYSTGVFVINYLFILFIMNPNQFIRDSYNNIVELCIILFNIAVECKMMYDETVEPFLEKYFTFIHHLFHGDKHFPKPELSPAFMYTVDGDLINGYEDEHQENQENQEDDVMIFTYRRHTVDDDVYYINTELTDSPDVKHLLFKNMPFFHIELKDQDNKTHDISANIKKFYIKGHSMDNVFFKAFMNYFYKVNIDENNYTVELITDQFENKTLKPEDVLHLLTRDKVEKIKAETDIITDSSSGDKKTD